MQASRASTPRQLMQLGATFFVAAAVGFVLGADLRLVIVMAAVGIVFVLLGAVGFRRGRRSG